MDRFSIPVGIKHPARRSAASSVTDGDTHNNNKKKNLCDSPLMKAVYASAVRLEYGS